MIGDAVDNPQHLIIMNHNGIAFYDASDVDGWPDANIVDSVSSTWAIDGTLNMQGINVQNLVATEIANQFLVLGNDPTKEDDDVAGSLNIHDRLSNISFETVLDNNGNLIDGFKIYKYKSSINSDGNISALYNGYIYLSRENGFQEYDAEGKTLFGNDNNTFYASKLRIASQPLSQTKEEERASVYGAQITPIYMDYAEDGLIHNGIGFIKIED